MKKKQYVSPAFEIVELKAEAILAASNRITIGTGNDMDQNEPDGSDMATQHRNGFTNYTWE